MAKATEVYVFDTALASARCDERVVVRGTFQEANTAHGGAEFFKFGGIHTTDLSNIIQPQLRLYVACRCMHKLPGAEFEAAQLDDIGLQQFVTTCGEVTNNQPQLFGAARWGSFVYPEGPFFLHEAE
jgi:hypothetical protein